MELIGDHSRSMLEISVFLLHSSDSSGWRATVLVLVETTRVGAETAGKPTA